MSRFRTEPNTLIRPFIRAVCSWCRWEVFDSSCAARQQLEWQPVFGGRFSARSPTHRHGRSRRHGRNDPPQMLLGSESRALIFTPGWLPSTVATFGSVVIRGGPRVRRLEDGSTVFEKTEAVLIRAFVPFNWEGRMPSREDGVPGVSRLKRTRATRRGGSAPATNLERNRAPRGLPPKTPIWRWWGLEKRP